MSWISPVDTVWWKACGTVAVGLELGKSFVFKHSVTHKVGQPYVCTAHQNVPVPTHTHAHAHTCTYTHTKAHAHANTLTMSDTRKLKKTTFIFWCRTMLIITLHGKYHLSLEYTACSKENYHQKKNCTLTSLLPTGFLRCLAQIRPNKYCSEYWWTNASYSHFPCKITTKTGEKICLWNHSIAHEKNIARRLYTIQKCANFPFKNKVVKK